MCMIHVMFSMSTHVSEHALCFYSHNRKDGIDVHDTLLLLWRQWCSRSARTNHTNGGLFAATNAEFALLGHLIRNLSMANKTRFMAHPTLLEEMLESVLREDQPIVVACAASILWSVSFNYKKIIPRMKRCNAELVFQRGLNILSHTDSPRSHTDSMIANAVQGLVRLSEWCKKTPNKAMQDSP